MSEPVDIAKLHPLPWLVDGNGAIAAIRDANRVIVLSRDYEYGTALFKFIAKAANMHASHQADAEAAFRLAATVSEYVEVWGAHTKGNVLDQLMADAEAVEETKK